VSPDILATILSAVGVLLAMAGGFGWVIARLDSRLDSGLSGLEQRLSTRIDVLSEEVGGLRGDVAELKVAVARLEGPARPPLLMLG